VAGAGVDLRLRAVSQGGLGGGPHRWESRRDLGVWGGERVVGCCGRWLVKPGYALVGGYMHVGGGWGGGCGWMG